MQALHSNVLAARDRNEADGQEIIPLSLRTGISEPEPPISRASIRRENDRDIIAALEQRYGERRELLTRATRSRVSALRQLTVLRRINEEMQNCFHGLERVLPAQANRLHLSFADEPSPAGSSLGLGWSSSGLTQILPVQSTGVSAFELNIGERRGGDGAVLHVHLVCQEDHLVLDRWTVPFEVLSKGWMMFCLTRALTGDPKTLQLQLDLECEADVHLGLGLGEHPTLAPFQARNPVANVAAATHGLAMRVWCGDAHSAYGQHGNAQIADARSKDRQGFYPTPMSPSLLARAEQVPTEGTKFGFEPVAWFPYRVAVGCHPPAHGMTLACVPLPATRVHGAHCWTEVGNPLSLPVQFNMMLTDNPQRVLELLAGTVSPEPHEAASGWHVSTPTEPVALLARPARVSAKGSKLYLATRMKQPGNKDYAWARFRAMSLILDARH